jgi:hypothetical protein
MERVSSTGVVLCGSWCACSDSMHGASGAGRQAWFPYVPRCRTQRLFGSLELEVDSRARKKRVRIVDKQERTLGSRLLTCVGLFYYCNGWARPTNISPKNN